MRPIADLVQKKPTYSDRTTQVGEADKVFINHLFDQLSAIFPAWKNAFANAEGVKNAKRQWLQGLLENQITTPEKIKKGLEMARRSESPFLPSVGMFISWCRDVNHLPEFKSPMLPNPATPEAARKNIEEMKRLLRHA